MKYHKALRSFLAALPMVALAGFAPGVQALAIFNTDVKAAVRVVDIKDANGNSINPSGDPLLPPFPPGYLSIQGDYSKPPATSVVTTGGATGSANATQQVRAGGVVQAQDVAGNPLGDGGIQNFPSFNPLGAAVGKDPAAPGPGLNIQDGVRLTADVSGQAGGSDTANADANNSGWIFLDNQLQDFFFQRQPVTVEMALDFEYSGATSGNQDGTSVSIRLLDNLAQDLITPITDSATGSGMFSDSGSIPFSVTLPTDPFGFDSFQTLNLTIQASGRAEAVPEPSALIVALVGVGFIVMLDLRIRRLQT